MNTTIRIDRLEKCYEALASSPPESFRLNCFRERTSCGTLHCAVGHYIEKNPECGLGFVAYMGLGFDFIAQIGKRCDTNQYKVVADHFGIDECQASYLFFPAGASGDHKEHFSYFGTLARIRTFIAENSPTILTLDFHNHDVPANKSGALSAVETLDWLLIDRGLRT